MSEQSSSNVGRHCEAPAGPWQSASPGGKETDSHADAAAPARNDLFAAPVAPFSKRGVASGVPRKPDAGGIESNRRTSDTYTQGSHFPRAIRGMETSPNHAKIC